MSLPLGSLLPLCPLQPYLGRREQGQEGLGLVFCRPGSESQSSFVTLGKYSNFSKLLLPSLFCEGKKKGSICSQGDRDLKDRLHVTFLAQRLVCCEPSKNICYWYFIFISISLILVYCWCLITKLHDIPPPKKKSFHDSLLCNKMPGPM